ncbi:hypothetical protein GCM10007874_40170 [Labrys miyagiensis]|uniref:Uncharacterized protein n=1 Tax=Labrys miyagiensis TaxID=346912 RepID=A0ABQ6CMD6_9HYPH|nr:hypothetical protein [Labrys miyagiensis]GLS21000.1 hypothetical protein GCM10007874_40170 [Labrys miyagiensis]
MVDNIKRPKEQKGQQPEALREFEAAARADGKKPDDQGLVAKPDTARLRDSPSRKDKAAADVLKAGVAHDPKAMTKVVQKSKDPRTP